MARFVQRSGRSRARWASSHTDEKAVEQGRIIARDRDRNAQADALAGEATKGHRKWNEEWDWWRE